MASPAHAPRLSPAARRVQLTAVASRMVEQNGLDELTMTGLAEAAGVTRALVYRYFPSRSDVIAAVLRQAADDLLAATAPRPGATVRENLERALTAYLARFGPALERLHGAPDAPRSFASALSHHVRAVQVERVRAQLVEPDAPGTATRLHAWLVMVEDLAASGSDDPTDVVAWSLAAAQGLLGANLDLDARPPAPTRS